MQERKAAKEFGGLTTPGSGNIWSAKGDVKTPDLLIECKTTTHDSYSLKKTVWEKIAREALIDGVLPAMLLDVNGLELVVLSKDDFLEMRS